MRPTIDTVTPSPRGIGLYLTSGDVTRPASEIVRLARNSSARWVALFVEAPDGRVARIDRLEVIASALADQLGVDTWCWSFPSAARADSAGVRLGRAAVACKAKGVIIDVERPPPGTGAPEWTAESARVLVRATVNSIREGVGIGVTSYPLRERFERHIPWDELLVGHGQPQLYKTAADDKLRERALSDWSATYSRVVPIVAGYLGDHERLRADLSRVCYTPGTDVPRVQGVGVWSLASIDGRERTVLREWADMVGW